MTQKFLSELRNIIKQGNNAEYQLLFNTIVLMHREEFNEENIPTAKGFLSEMLNSAIRRVEQKESIEYSILEHQRAIAALKEEEMNIK